jgi:hypothetical protein
LVTETAAKKEWNCPKLILLGRIADVAGTFGTHTENSKVQRS